MKILKLFSIIILLSLFMQNSLADEYQPEIYSPPDQTLEQGDTGKIVWNVVDENPDAYRVLRNGILVKGPSTYKSGKKIPISINSTQLGIWNYIIYANDTFGNSASDQVDINIIDNTSPIITGSDEQTIEQDATGYIIWTINEKNPGEYQVLKDGSLINSATYEDGEDIEISIDSSMLGTLNYTINAKDISGNIASDYVIITVVDNAPPIITGPDGQVIALNATRNIDWHIIEKNPDQLKILINGDQIGESKPYQNDSLISFPIDSSIPGVVSIYTLIAYDTSGKFSSDGVKVTVISGLDTIPPVITGPEDQIIEQDADYVLTWNIVEDNPNIYEIKKDGVSQEISSYTSGIDIDFPLYTHIVGNFNYYIEANDDTGNMASQQVDITIEKRVSPEIAGPSEISVNKGSAGNIVVNIFDLSPAYYWVLRNVNVTSQPNTYHSGDVSIPLDTSTLGIWNYTIFANDTFGDVSSKQVKVNVIQPPPSSGGSSSSGGGGGGGTGEAHLNILMYEKNSQYVYKNEPVIYDFSKEGNIVTSFSFTGMKKAGKILAKIEMLNTTSSLVTVDPPAQIYKNFNLWCGFEGWFSNMSVANPKLEFTVEKSWVSDNNILPSSINIYKFNKDSWNEISTRMDDEDSSKYYFVSDLPIESMGPLAVSGKKDLSSSANPGGSGMLLESSDPNVRSPDSEPVPTPVTTVLWAESVPGFQGFSLLIIILTLYIFIRKQD
jgi:PGF-pre-PGF domain-containing protein